MVPASSTQPEDFTVNSLQEPETTQDPPSPLATLSTLQIKSFSYLWRIIDKAEMLKNK